MTTLTRTFHFYRYQILPTIPPEQMELAFNKEDYTTIEELVSQKNEIFARVLREQKSFRHVRAELTHLLWEFGDFIVLKIGAKRGLIRITKDFKMEQLDTWPSVFVVINNDPNVQIIAVEEEADAFYRTSTVVHVLSTNLNEKLKKYRLQLEIRPTFERNEFWSIVRNYQRRIVETRFFMVAPNLAKISKGLELDLRELRERTNSVKTNMDLQAPRGESLTLSEDDSFIQSLVTYASEGGGTIHLKVKNISKLIKTEDSIRSTEVDEIYFTGENVPQQLIEQLGAQLRKILE
jgi:hypothetical protein